MPQSVITVRPDGSFGHSDATALLTVTATGADVVLLPAASRATAVSVCAPLATVVVSQTTDGDAALASLPRLAPSSWNCTPTTPTLSVAFAETTTLEPDTLLPFDGDVIATVGGVVSVEPDAR